MLYKFRTMIENADKLGAPSTSDDDWRLTKIGRFLRRYQIDELPNLINVLKGDMALVGCRPEIPSEIDDLDEKTKNIILSIKPGLTSPASLWDFSEEEMLKGRADPHKYYQEHIRPKKMELNVWYVKNKSFWLDCKIILQTLAKIIKKQ